METSPDVFHLKDEISKSITRENRKILESKQERVLRESRIREKAETHKAKEMANERWKSFKAKPLAMMLGKMKKKDGINLVGSLNSKMKME